MRRWFLLPLLLSATLALAAVTYVTQTVSTTALALTTSSAYSYATCSVEDAGIRYRYDGTNPTANEGQPIEAGGAFVVYGGANIQRFRLIRSGGSDATVRCHLE